MPSFDVVSEVDLHELANAVDQTNREVGNRFDFKGTDSRVELAEHLMTLHAPSDFQVRQVYDILIQKLAKRGIDTQCLDAQEIELSGQACRQEITARAGIDADLARRLVREVKNLRLKVQAAVQGDQVRITGKKRDDLQQVIQHFKAGDFGLPLQYSNFRD